MAAWQTKYVPRALGTKLSDGTPVVLPLMVRRGALRGGLFGRAVSTVPNTYGGPIAAGRLLNEADWRELFARFSSLKLGRVLFFWTPNQIPPPQLTSHLPQNGRCTYLVHLDQIQGELLHTYHNGCAGSVKKGRRSDLVAEPITRLEDLKEYFGVYRNSLSRWGKSESQGFPFRLFEALYATPGVEFWTVKLPSKMIVAGGIFLYWNRNVTYWQGAMLIDHKAVCPSHFLLDQVMENSRRRGCQLFDFNPSGGLKGVEAFKASFGAHREPAPRWTWRHRLLDAFTPRRRRS